MVEESIAEKMAKEMKEVSVAEFFEKNRHLLGYENPTKALLTVVKEAVDNSLDACCEAGILPEIKVVVKPTSGERFRVMVEDNGPGVVESKVPYAFGKFLYGSKFHRLKQSRGIQGLGIHGAVLYSQLTTGKPTKITTSIGKDIHIFELMIDVVKNEPIIVSHTVEKNPSKWHGVKVEMEIEGKYVERAQSITEYLRQTAIANPYAKIIFDGPSGKTTFERAVEEMPREPREIKPHPYGVEIGLLRRMLSSTKTRNILQFLTSEFSRVGKRSAEQICRLAKLEPNKKPSQLTHEESERLHKAMQLVKLKAPPTDCLSPLGEKLIREGLEKETGAEYVVAVTRSPAVYRGNPFLVEVGLAYGGNLPEDQTAELLRFANKVPLLYHQGDCALTEATIETDFRRYGLSQSQGQLPVGPLVIFIHFASVWVPFTSEGKQAIAKYPEILREVKLALQEAGRRLASYVRQIKKARESRLRRELFEKYIPEFAESLEKLTNEKKQKIIEGLEKILEKGGVGGKEEGSKEES
ncbi:MAG: DNA topoisomerase VI subunit B [Candidatus Aenigmatarchaeota archaeon]